MVENAPVPKLLRAWLAGAILAVGILFVFVVYQASTMAELSGPRAMDIAQLARNLARGQGYTTEVITPLGLAIAPRVSDHPDMLHAPLQPQWMSVLFRLFGPSTRTVSWSSGIPFLLTIPLVYWLGLSLFSRKVGMLSALVLVTNIAALQVGVAGTEAGLLGLFFTMLCGVLLLHQSRASLRLPLAAAAGLLSGLLYLTHFYWIVGLPAAVLVVVLNTPTSKRVPQVLVCLAAFAVVVAPWFYRVYRATGNPLCNLAAYEMVINTRTWPGNLVYRSFETSPPGVISFAVSAPREIYERGREYAMALYPNLFAFTGMLVMAFFLVGVIVPLGHTAADRLRPGLYVALVLLATVMCLMLLDSSLLVPMAPIITVLALAFFYQLLDLRLRALTERLRARWTIVAVVILMAIHVVPLFLQLAPGKPVPPDAPIAIRRASQELNALIPQLSGREAAPAAVLTDFPWPIAWHADRPAIWVPRNDVDLRRIEQAVGQIRWLVLTRELFSLPRAENATSWGTLYEMALRGRPVKSDWRPRQVLANGHGSNWILFERVSDVASVGTLPATPRR